MRRSVFLLGLLIMLIGLGAGAWLYLGAGQTYSTEGRIAGFGDEPSTVFIEHERIPGYMPAMTMPFSVADTAQLSGFELGDPVRFELRVRNRRPRITRIERAPDSAVARHPAGRPSGAASAGSGRGAGIGEAGLQEGKRVPDVSLLDQRGDSLSLRTLRGKTVALTFIYTRCPVPDQCPLMSRNFETLQPRFREAFGDRAHLISVSFDPEYDRPDVLREYAARYTDRTDNWTFATGAPEEIGRLTSFFQIYTRQGDDQIVHNLTTAVIGPDGRVRAYWRGNEWNPDAVFEAVRRVVRQGSAGTGSDRTAPREATGG